MFRKIKKVLWRLPKNFLINIWKYKRFLWNDFWWDSHHIFYMLREKLKNDVKMYKKYAWNLNADGLIEEMELCIKLLNRIIKDEYLDNALIPFDKKYSNWMEKNFLIKDGKYMGFSDKKQSKLFSKAGERSELQLKQDVEYLFKIMNKHILTWWD